ncbi:MAG: mannose-6-phosphate isomerase [Actinomycetia bacterium]|nr:mannose-6-phosphate isomerase [Actinomycetes bacterium]
MNTPHGGAAFAAYRLDDPELVEAGDPGGMLRQVASSAAQVRTALRACEESDLNWLRPDSRPRAVIVAGAGVGVLAGEILAAIVGQSSPVQVLTVSGDSLPGWVGAADLVVAPSSSGHTAEALALAREAARRGCGLMAVAPAGSPIQEIVTQARGVLVPVTSAGTARSSLWTLTVPLIVVAERLGLVTVGTAGYEAAASAMEDVSHQCRPSSESFVNPGKSLALDLVGTLPVVWGGSPLAVTAARRFAAQLAANAKYPALQGELPGIGRDQVAVFDGAFAPRPEPDFPSVEDPLSDPFADSFEELDPLGSLDSLDSTAGGAALRLVLIADEGAEHPRVTVSRQATALLAAARGIDVSELAMDGDQPLRKLAAVLQLADYASVYLGIAGGIDPLAIAAIGDLRDLTEQAG